jgi:PAS domain-containing protein
MTVPRSRVTAGAAPGTGPADPLAAMLPLLRALPLPAVLYRLDGTVAGASAALEELVGAPVGGLTVAELAALLHVRFPTGRVLDFDDLCRSLGEEPRPMVALDLRDRDGRFYAMIASAGVVRSGGEMAGIVVLLSDITGLIETDRNEGPARA